MKSSAPGGHEPVLARLPAVARDRDARSLDAEHVEGIQFPPTTGGHGAGLYDQQNSFLGKLALHLVVFAILIFRSNESLASLKNLLDEATFYDKQWQANWLNTERPKEED